ncbi:MAG: D-alanyl-D-alanine carboxypeptidase [Candidatus Calescibacterium sp.]|nr:D-alanyl-D-alanine carboxypeptidase [Candidatus Calescibacterium sp.]MDW8132700.1 D-alanyl-D-alanine carboxypeptidase [Candidatus Calescibacterium sp.]
MNFLILIFLYIFLIYSTTVYSKNIPITFDNKTSIAIFDVYSNEIVFFHNERLNLLPASTMKLITSINALSTLGPLYTFDVKIQKDNNNIIITSNYNPTLIEEIIPDPYNFLKQGIKNILEANSIKIIEKVYIESILPSYFPESWKIYEGEPYAPYLSTFSFNQNMIKIQKKENNFILYPPIFEELKDYRKISSLISNLNEIDGAYWYIYPSAEEYNLRVVKKIFEEMGYKIEVELLKNQKSLKTEYLGSFPTSTLIEALKYQNYWSDNFISQQIYNKLKYEFNIDFNLLYRDFNVFIDDGCGLSRKNRVSTYFLAYLLSQLDDYGLINFLCYTLPGYNQGTLEKRNLPLTIKAKTGTLNDVSSLAGYIKTKKSNWYSFAIIYNGPNVYNAKINEEKILNYIYNNW